MHATLLLGAVEVGNYINGWKVLPVVIILAFWARLLTWIDKDADDAHLPRMALNTGFIVGFIAGFFAFLFLPNFWVALSVLLFVLIVEVAVYLVIRNQKVGLADLGGKISGIFKSGKEKTVVVAAGEVGIVDKAGKTIAPPDSESPDLIGYLALQQVLTDPIKRRAEEISVRPSEGAAAVTYEVDGMPYSGMSMSREDAAAAVAYAKQIAGMDLNDKRKPQSGKLKLLINNKKRDAEVHTAGSTAGESLSIEIEPKKKHDFRLETLGFSAEQIELIKSSIQEKTGVVLLSTPEHQGLRSLVYGVIRGHDAFLTNIHTIERDSDVDLEGITQNNLAGNAPAADEIKLTEWVTSQEPDVLAVTRVTDARAAAVLVKFAGTERRVYVGLRATNTFDALAQWRRLVGDDKVAMKQLRMIINGRVVRKLCMACKVGYSPEPETLRKLNMDPEKVGRLYQARTQPLRDPKGNPIPCEFCHDLRFVGRTGVYEIFEIDDEVRNVVQAGGSTNQLKALFRKQRRKYLQEQALEVVEAGETSVQEVLRVMKIGGDAGGGRSSGGGGGGGGGAPAPRRDPSKPTKRVPA